MKLKSNSTALNFHHPSLCVSSLLAASLVAWLLAISSASAALKTWDGTTSGNWGTSANWTPAAAPVDGDDLSFPAGALNPLNTNNITDLRVASITFSGAAGAYFLTGNAITVSNGVTSANTAGDNDLNFVFITNAAAQTYTVDSGGTLDVNANIVLIGGFTLTVNNDFTTRFDGAISGTGNLSKSSLGIGTMVLGGTAANTYAGTTTVNGAILQLSKTAGIVSVPGDLTIGASDTVLLATDNQIANSSDVTISSSTGLLDLNGNLDTIATLTFNGGTVDTGVGGDLTTGNITVNASASSATISGTLSFTSTRTITVVNGTANPDLLVSAVIEGAGGVTVNNLVVAGRVDFSGANTYSGLTTLSNGFLFISNPSGLGSSAVGTVLAGGNLTIIGVTISGEGLTNITASTLQGTGSVWTGPVVLNALLYLQNTIELSGVISGTGAVNKIGGGTVRYSGANANTYTGTTTVESGTLELAKSAGVDAILGDLVIGDGVGTDTVRTFASNLIDNTSDVTLNEGAVLDLQTFIEAVNSATMTGATVDGTGNSFNPISFLTVNNSAIQSSISKTFFVNNNNITVANGTAATDLLISGAVAGSAGFTKLGAGLMSLTAAGTFTGTATVSAGILSLANDDALGTTAGATTVSSGATMMLQVGVNNLPEVLTLNGTGTSAQGALYSLGVAMIQTNLVLGSATTINVATNGGSPGALTINGGISGTGNLTKIGVGTLTFAGSPGNTYAGNTTVNEGVLELAKALAISSGTLTIGDGVGLFQSDIVRYSADNAINSSVPIVIAGTGLLDLNGFNDTVGAITIFGGGRIKTGTGTMTINDNLRASGGLVGGTAIIEGNLSLGAAARTFTVTNTPIPAVIDFSIVAKVSGTGGIIKTGDGDMALSGSNSFSGAVTVNDGALWLHDDFAAGTTAGGVTVNNDAQLRLFGSIHVGAEALTLNSTQTNGVIWLDINAGSNSWAGPITLSADATIRIVSGETLNLLGSISGPGGVTKLDLGTLYYSGGSANTYAGVTTVNAGTLVLAKSGFNSAMTNNLVIGDGVGGVNADVVRLEVTTQLPNTVAVTVNSSGLFDVNGIGEAFGSLAGSGNVTLDTATIGPGNDDSSTTFSGVISGTGGVGKSGTGTMTFEGNNTYAGTTTVANGKLVVNGSQPQSPVTVGAVGILGGAGTVGIIVNTAGGVVAPGTSPGTLTCSNLNFSGVSSDFTVELNGTTPGSGHDQLNVRGTNSLGNCTLNVTVGGGFLPVEGVPLVILNNDGAEVIVGTFNGLAEGAIKTVGTFDFRISYAGGSGNDVTLSLTNTTLKPGAATVLSGNGNGVIEVNECNLLSLVVSNLDGSVMTGVSATLQSLTPGIAVVQPFSGYPDIPAGLRRTNNTFFQVSALPSFVCGTNVDLQLKVATTSHGTLLVPFTLPSGVTGSPVLFANISNFAVPDSGSVTSTVVVAGIGTPIRKVTVSLHITHTTAEDLDVSLQAPDGTTINLTSDNGGTGDDYGTDCLNAQRTVFDDAAASSIVGQPVPFVGTFRPEQALTAFNGKTGAAVNGTWRLIIADDAAGGVGTLRCWSLFISPAACTPGGGACELCPEVTLTGATGPSSPTQAGNITISGIPSGCGVPKVCPGTAGATPHPSENYVFRNGPSNACITVTLANQSPIVAMLVTAYTNSYNPANPDRCVNYLADGGNVVDVFNPTQAFSFNLSADAVFVVNVIGSTATLAPYRLTVTGGDCRPVLNIAAASTTQAVLDWTTAAVGYRLERTNNLPSVSNVWHSVPAVPSVVNSRFTVTNDVNNTNQFYRLVKP